LLAEIVLALSTLHPTNTPNKYVEQDGTYCGTVGEILEQRPTFAPDDYIMSFIYKAKNGIEFLIGFYKNGVKAPKNMIGDPASWIDNLENYDAFVIYELYKQGNQREFSTVSGYIKGNFLFVLYDFFMRKGKRLLNTAPDGFIEEAKCFVLGTRRTSSIVLDEKEGIATRRKGSR